MIEVLKLDLKSKSFKSDVETENLKLWDIAKALRFEKWKLQYKCKSWRNIDTDGDVSMFKKSLNNAKISISEKTLEKSKTFLKRYITIKIAIFEKCRIIVKISLPKISKFGDRCWWVYCSERNLQFKNSKFQNQW